MSSFFSEPIVLSTSSKSYGKTALDEIFQVEVKEYFTAVSGTCYQIRSNTSVPPSSFVSISLRFNDSLGPKDLPQVSKHYLQSTHIFEITIIYTWYIPAMLLGRPLDAPRTPYGHSFDSCWTNLEHASSEHFSDILKGFIFSRSGFHIVHFLFRVLMLTHTMVWIEHHLQCLRCIMSQLDLEILDS